MSRKFERLPEMIDHLGLRYKRSGRGYLGECPFCGGGKRTPCFSFNDEVYHCFSCGESGNFVRFAKRWNLPLGSGSYTNRPERKKYEEEMRELNTSFLFNFNKVPDRSALVWLEKRGIEYEAVKELVYFPVPKRYKGYPAGYRLAFPFIDREGRVRGIKVRNVLGREPKTLAYTGSQLYSIGIHHLYCGIQLQTDWVLVVEGEMDWLAIKSISPEYPVIALPGAGYSFKPSEVKSLPKNVVLLLDNDEAGRKAAVKLQQQLTEEGKSVRVASYPDGVKDFNDLLLLDRQVAAEFIRAIKSG